jgi:hypothetical protein
MRARGTCPLDCGVVVAAAVAAGLTPSAEGAAGRSLTKRDAAAVEEAREEATRRLANDECRRVLSDFHDGRGRTLDRNLEEWALEPAEYLRVVPFVDGTGEPLCRSDSVKLVSTPSVPRIVVCPSFAEVGRLRPDVAPIMVIHEMLHTLGLGENPPTSAEITERVAARCR